LQAAAQVVTEPAAVERIVRAVDDLDNSIRQVRSTIFELNERWSGLNSVRSEIQAFCDEAADTLGFKPTCHIDGPIDSAVSDRTRGHLLLCIREALSNVARHAHATHVEVRVMVRDGRVRLIVADDGIGYEPTPGQRSSGLDNMAVRAESLHGRFSIMTGLKGGTTIEWDVPCIE